MKKTTREWVGKAEDDYQLAAEGARLSRPFHDQVCFHCQQAAEKYLKALIEELALPVTKTHDLERLFGALLPHQPTLRTLRRGLKFLTNFSVAIRYPGEKASKRQAASALRWAGQVRDACRTVLHLRPPRSRCRRSL
jgi:HEPN domain-containing protein